MNEEKKKEAIVESVRFYEMEKHGPVEYQTRGPSLSMEELHKGLDTLGIRVLLYDRIVAKSPGQIISSASLQLKPSQILVPIKFLAKLRHPNQTEDKEGSRVFFFGFRSYDQRLEEYRKKLHEIYASIDLDKIKLQYLQQVPIGGVFVLKSTSTSGDEKFYRVRVTRINLTSKMISYWAVDEAFHGECYFTNLLKLNKSCSSWMDMLAVPGIYEDGNTFSRLQKFEGPSRGFNMAIISQPKLAFDSIPRTVLLHGK